MNDLKFAFFKSSKFSWVNIWKIKTLFAKEIEVNVKTGQIPKIFYGKWFKRAAIVIWVAQVLLFMHIREYFAWKRDFRLRA